MVEEAIYYVLDFFIVKFDVVCECLGVVGVLGVFEVAMGQVLAPTQLNLSNQHLKLTITHSHRDAGHSNHC